MNVYDSERMIDALAPFGYVPVEEAESADLVLSAAAQMATAAPHAVFRNPEHLARGWEQHRAERAAFIEFFGADHVVFATDAPLGPIRPTIASIERLDLGEADRRKIFAWSNEMIGYDDPEYGGDSQAAAAELVGYAMIMAEDRRGCPRDDIVTKLVHAQVDGGQLSADEFGFFVILLAVAGNETTRNAISHGMLAFFDHPDQWERFLAERPESAVDEIVRWATPVTAFQRTALSDTTLSGQQIKAGQRVGLFYRSANFDEEVFEAPEKFDIQRDPNPHLGFGGTGTHYCLGVNLARLEIDLIFNAIADGMPGIKLAGDAERLRSGWLNGIKKLPVSYR